MLIRSEFDIQFQLPAPVTMLAMLDLHPSVDAFAREVTPLAVEHVDGVEVSRLVTEKYLDNFGNRCSRVHLPAGAVRLSGSNVVEIEGAPDAVKEDAQQAEVRDLPAAALPFLFASRYCEVDRMCGLACDLFGGMPKGWPLAAAIRDWVHDHVRFDYNAARPTKTALDVFTERVGVCRDFQHLAITLTRAMNLPARYVAGYLGDIRSPYAGPGDFSAWYEIFLDGRWWTMDARHNHPRIGRVLMATGRDATDVAITTTFGVANLTHFYVESNETDGEGNLILPPGHPETSIAA
ncbi:transglutaminase-like domain-containing protein [Terriglobus albidus]|uniref:transglutaminase-like domain-containing protein n=1 Tax=Terriglobus albidus TaxID=1592106 RepID=UPI0021DF86D8|nr:transglutaminase family protein [Terriglobus albidus]